MKRKESKWQDTKKRVRIWVEPSNSPTDPRICELLKPLILDFAMIEDVENPLHPGFSGDALQEDYTRRLREPIVTILKTMGIVVSEKELNSICGNTGGEVMVVRALRTAIEIGEITLGDIKHLDLYRTYQGYFEKTADYLDRAAEVAATIAAMPRKRAEGN